MKAKMLNVMIAALFCATSSVYAHDSHSHHEGDAHYHIIHTEQVKALVDSGKPIVILDARTTPYDDKNRLPSAKFLPYDTSEEVIGTQIPSKNSLVIVYCTGKGCPASDYLAEKLVNMGYQNVYEYPEGIQGWMAKGYSVEKAQ